MNEEQKTALYFIQDTITRLSQKSFLVKGWSGGILGLSISFNKVIQPSVAVVEGVCFILVVFWFLNALYLHNERLFRKLYDIKIQPGLADYLSIDLNVVRGNYCQNLRAFICAFLSRTVLPFHLAFLICTLTFLSVAQSVSPS